MTTNITHADNFISYEQNSVLNTLPFDPYAAIVGPRPIGWMGTKSKEGISNLSPYSFFNALNHQPALLGFASIGYKDTVRNIEQTGEFTWNLVSRDIAAKMNQSSVSAPPDVDEFMLAGLTKAPSRLVEAPRVAESPVSLECRLSEIIRLKSSQGKEVDTWFVYGEVVYVHIRKDLLVDGIYDTVKGRPVLRGGGLSDFFEIIEASRFAMMKPEDYKHKK
ncbi:flavin reductase family protein [Noviherbaspirillum sedimenti]|uniref:Flavin reductase family protein n=1 Tax=Noviherbaspirillum sedimenti TaxID=2320865 RepID=A0A3A3G7R1_9BURK|nr:flavin reductase family protein [Noviherbaspirillum sedimenti]RJG04011.1 flavin reductase family protein [Noviherbaspirillum sedimenti]